MLKSESIPSPLNNRFSLWVIFRYVVMCRTSNKLRHNFSNIEQTWTYSSIGDETGTPNFWLWTIEHQTSNLIDPSLDLLNCLSNRLKHLFLNIEWTWTCSSFENQTRTPYFWLWTIEHWTSNIVWPITTDMIILIGFLCCSILATK